ncbi:glycerate kinase [Brevibacterium sp. p3-SID960]|uniref:glycerate kinase n=1 Tax=Brevibacterium sp. p3-SID960 TaxID=2916063 RepID=UPI0021A3A1DA|nr:glycerate kinase [Brevibacterium sp. p3-SID960]MCT1690760.1 glycerate kinase [Brevibacterium sp. p3-SID960]
MHILLACDSFKGTLTSTRIAELLAPALQAAGHSTSALPLADGGDGTVAAVAACGFTEHTAEVTGPLGTPVTAAWARRGEVAVIEMAQASGINLILPTPETALQATTLGTGELVRIALDAGCTTIVLGVGGSATTDGGAGMLTALGARLHTAAGTPIPPGGAGLEELVNIDLSGLDPRLVGADPPVRLELAFDVDNPLCGPRGAAAVYGPQKGAGPEEVRRLDSALAHLAGLLGSADDSDRPGAGAAGGIGFAAMTVLGAEPMPGAGYIMDLLGFDAALGQADAVITGEGRIDDQTLSGKGPGAVLAAAGARGLLRIVVCGSADVSADELAGLGSSVSADSGAHESPPRVRLYAMTDIATVQTSLTEPERVMTALAERIAATLPAAADSERREEQHRA